MMLYFLLDINKISCLNKNLPTHKLFRQVQEQENIINKIKKIFKRQSKRNAKISETRQFSKASCYVNVASKFLIVRSGSLV